MRSVLMFLVGVTIVAAMLFLSGCNADQVKKVQADVQDIVKPVQQTTLADAQAALIIAQVNNDPAGVACFSSVVAFLSDGGGLQMPVVNGVLSALEAARTFKAPQVPPDIHRNCAVLIVDAQETALRLGLPKRSP